MYYELSTSYANKDELHYEFSEDRRNYEFEICYEISMSKSSYDYDRRNYDFLAGGLSCEIPVSKFCCCICESCSFLALPPCSP